jgi:SAM-dependent methyltransferase/uncharacterized protein YbaR (Trm112 family)
MDVLQLNLPEWAIEALRCPICGDNLSFQVEKERCMNKKCNAIFPIINRIPILINSKKSLFSIDDFVNTRDTYFKYSQRSLIETIFKLAPKMGANIKASENYSKLVKFLRENSKNPRVLVLGGSIFGKGMEALFNSPAELVETDVSFGPRTMAIVDAHDIPFADNTFNCVIAQAMLEHVADSYICVKEMYRVLKPGGIVYAEAAFMQQVHGGKFDFTRFTHLGHRRLFSQFQEIESGAVCGTGMALAWAYEYFLISLSNSSTIQMIMRLFARITAFWLKYFDYFTINNPRTLDGASGYFFLGRKP